MLLHGGPHDPRALFDRFVDDLSNSSDGQHHVAATLHALEDIMQPLGRSLTEKDFGFVLPELPPHPGVAKWINRICRNSLLFFLIALFCSLFCVPIPE